MRQKYLKNKDTTEYAAWKTQYWRNLLLEIGLLHENNAAVDNKILDAGCGPAGIFMIFDKNQLVDALDPLIDEYEATLPHFKRAFYPNVRFLNQPLEELNAKNTYDYIFCLNAINHVSNLTPL